jgi:hypothetical protein
MHTTWPSSAEATAARCSIATNHPLAAVSTLVVARPKPRWTISALTMVIAKRFLWDWLREVYSPEEIDRAAVVAAGHHRKFPVRAVAESGTSAARCTVRLAHPDFARVLQIGVKQLGLPAVLPALEDQPVARHEAEQLLDEAHDECVALSHNDVDLAVAKAFLLAADVLGSAEPTAARREQFVDDALARRATREELASIAETRLKGKQPRQFQLGAGHARHRRVWHGQDRRCLPVGAAARREAALVLLPDDRHRDRGLQGLPQGHRARDPTRARTARGRSRAPGAR